ncbi:DUF5694 domain-containing protein [Pedobacter yulinensis]|nr:DUF5694 domain-containing protein [Pedobacter yulinensis]
MKRLIKPLILTFVLCTTLLMANAQQLEIMVVGSSHDNPAGSEDFNAVVSRLKTFKPDMVFGEYVPPRQLEELAPENWARRAFAKGKSFMERQFPEKINDLDRRIARAKRSLAKRPDQNRLRMDLASWYARTNDRANTEYQVWVIEQARKKTFTAADQAYYNAHFLNQDSLKNVRLYRPASEYSTIFFPLISELGLDGIGSMDCQKFDPAWSKAWAETAADIRALAKLAKADSASQAAATVRAIEAFGEFTPEDKRKMSKSAYVNMNTDRYAELNDAWNFYGGRPALVLPGFPAEKARRMYAEWTNRNEGMCANLLEQTRAAGARRVVVAVGAAHRKIMADILARHKDVKVVSYNDF